MEKRNLVPSVLLVGAFAFSGCKKETTETGKDPDTAAKVSVDRFSATAGHLMVRDGSNGLPAANAAINFDVAPFITTGYSPTGAVTRYYNFDVMSTTDEMMLVYFAYTIYQASDENIVTDTTSLVDISDSIPTGISEFPNTIVSTPQLYDPIPNPSNTETQFNYFLPQQSNEAEIKIFDLNGRLMEEIKATGNSGFNSVKYNTGNLAKGDYLLTLIVNDFSRTKNLVVIH